MVLSATEEDAQLGPDIQAKEGDLAGIVTTKDIGNVVRAAMRAAGRAG